MLFSQCPACGTTTPHEVREVNGFRLSSCIPCSSRIQFPSSTSIPLVTALLICLFVCSYLLYQGDRQLQQQLNRDYALNELLQ